MKEEDIIKFIKEVEKKIEARTEEDWIKINKEELPTFMKFNEVPAKQVAWGDKGQDRMILLGKEEKERPELLIKMDGDEVETITEEEYNEAIK